MKIAKIIPTAAYNIQILFEIQIKPAFQEKMP